MEKRYTGEINKIKKEINQEETNNDKEMLKIIDSLKYEEKTEGYNKRTQITIIVS